MKKESQLAKEPAVRRLAVRTWDYNERPKRYGAMQRRHNMRRYVTYTVSQKTSHCWLAITLTHINGFWYFLAQILPIK